ADEYEMYRVQKMAFLGRKDKTGIVYNSNVTLTGIPEEVFEYRLMGNRSALEWVIDRYQVTVHKASQIRNDPNDYSQEIGNPRYIIDLIKRIVTVSLETNKIVANLPALEIIE
ncbi:type ISP restriction/modification enzyme, partial [Glutamicibacter arilaitensis]|uniref:type ISP restriction/modification enzyme n=1 Tax=Glutamicibacter arilaitensis TaxID=256701 RepID=UPI003FD4B90B